MRDAVTTVSLSQSCGWSEGTSGDRGDHRSEGNDDITVGTDIIEGSIPITIPGCEGSLV